MYCSYCHQERGREAALTHDTKDCELLKRDQAEIRNRPPEPDPCTRCGGSGEIRHGGRGYDPFDHVGDGYEYVTCSTCGGSGKAPAR